MVETIGDWTFDETRRCIRWKELHRWLYTVESYRNSVVFCFLWILRFHRIDDIYGIISTQLEIQQLSRLIVWLRNKITNTLQNCMLESKTTLQRIYSANASTRGIHCICIHWMLGIEKEDCERYIYEIHMKNVFHVWSIYLYIWIYDYIYIIWIYEYIIWIHEYMNISYEHMNIYLYYMNVWYNHINI